MNELFSPIYTIIFVMALLSITYETESLLKNWNANNLMMLEKERMETYEEMISRFDKEEISYETSLVLNVSVNQSSIVLEHNGMAMELPNRFHMPNAQLKNRNHLKLAKNERGMVIS